MLAVQVRKHLDTEDATLLTAIEDLIDDDTLIELGRRMEQRGRVIEARRDLVTLVRGAPGSRRRLATTSAPVAVAWPSWSADGASTLIEGHRLAAPPPLTSAAAAPDPTLRPGGVAERPKAATLKVAGPERPRGFESHLLRAPSGSLTCAFAERNDDGATLGPRSLRRASRASARRLQAPGKLVQLVGEQVPIGVQGDRGGGVAELGLDRLDGGALADRSDAHVWRRSYSRSRSGRPARAAGLKYRVVHFDQRIGPPSGAGNTRSSAPCAGR